jgi:hypothetical protein
MKDVKARAPHAICEMTTTGTQINLMVNRVNPPFDNPEIRKAMSLALDRKPFNAILMEGNGRMGGAMLPQPEGEWGMPPDMLEALPGYGPEKIQGKVFCAANPQRSTCQGDSGGPIILTNGAPTLVGIISWGKKRCTGDGQPGVYTRVESFLDWISQAMKLDPKKNALP